jgi:RNA polymerase sigma-70 factor (ECF subfamily)
MLRRMGLRKEDADDLAQEVFVVALRRTEHILPGKERSFLIGVTLHLVATQQRGHARRQQAYARAEVAPEPRPSPEELVGRRRQLAALDAALATLSDEQRSVFVLYELEGLEQQEIAEALGLARGTVASRLRLARERFTNALQRGRGRGHVPSPDVQPRPKARHG